MGCKVNIRLKNSKTKSDLIETLWDVKAGKFKELWDKAADLIETLWDVKQYTGSKFAFKITDDLIETLWDVKVGTINSTIL